MALLIKHLAADFKSHRHVESATFSGKAGTRWIDGRSAATGILARAIESAFPISYASCMIRRLHLEEVRNEGFCTLSGLVYREELDAFEQTIGEVVASFQTDDPDPNSGQDPFISLFRNNREARKLLFSSMERLAILHRITARIEDDLRKQGFFEWAGIRVPLVWPDLRVDLPWFSKNLLPVHQDYRSTRSVTAFRLWIPLRPANEQFGTMCLYPGTHRNGPVAHDFSEPARPRIPGELYDEATRVVLDLPAGDGVLIDPMVFHGSIPNRSSRTKFTLMIQLQDLATLILPGDPRYASFKLATNVRLAAEQAIEGS